MTESAYKTSFFRPTPQLLSPPDTSSDSIVKVIKPLYNVLDASINHFATYNPHYKKNSRMTESAYKTFFFWPPPKLLSLSNVLFDCIDKFAITHPNYKDKLVDNLTQTFMCAANCLCFLSGWNNFSTVSFFAYDSGACNTELGLVTKKGKSPRTFLHLFSDAFQPPSLIFSSTILEMRPAMLQ